MLTAEGRMPPSAVYKANFPTGIPIPYNISNMVVANITFPLINSMKKFVLKVKQEECLSIMTWQPRSPSPKMRSPSVTTITWILLSGQFFKTSRIFPLYGYYIKSKFMHYRCRTAKEREWPYFSFRLMYRPWGRLKILPYFWQASPTVGV